MLANNNTAVQNGQFSSSVQRPNTFISQIIEFITNQLPIWRDRKDRPRATAETLLTSQLCAHLNSVSRGLSGLDILQFRVEERDDGNASRTLDLVPSPSGTIIEVDGRSYTDFDYLIPIECKRLPTPSGSTRDEKEYVHNSIRSTGGLDRFKRGVHGSTYDQGMMIGFVQTEDCLYWFNAINNWIKGLAATESLNWQLPDVLGAFIHNLKGGCSSSKSTHIRDNNLGVIKLTHAWVNMGKTIP